MEVNMIRETASQRDSYGKGSITLEGSAEAIDAIRAALIHGTCWLSVNEAGDPQRHDKFRALPDPVDDPKIPPKWYVKPVPKLGECTAQDIGRVSREIIDCKPFRYALAPEIDPDEGWHSPSFFLQHLGAMGGLGGYRQAAAKAASIGFECMRSRRGPNGNFWEVWYLPFVEHARGALKGEIAQSPEKDWRKNAERITRWLCNNVSFGSLDISVQRAALVFD